MSRSRSNANRLFSAVLGMGWFPVPPPRIDICDEWSWNTLRYHGALRSVTGDVTFPKRVDLLCPIWAKKDRPKLSGPSTTYLTKAMFGTVHEDEVDIRYPLTQAPKVEVDKHVPDGFGRGWLSNG